MDTPMIPRDPQLFAEAWALDALRRRPWCDDAALWEYLTARAIFEDLAAAEDRWLRWWVLADELAALLFRALLCFFALLGLFVAMGQAQGRAAELAALLTAGAAVYALWELARDFTQEEA